MKPLNQAHIYSVYFAPRGRERLLALGEQISQRHLSYEDRLIGIVGDAGSGKSLVIKGMFPGVELSNDDDGINVWDIMQVRNNLDNDYKRATYHLDMRFQMAFTQMYEIVDFVKGALEAKRRVIIEHFDLLYPALKINADIIIGVGEEIIVTRPNLFGPLPKGIYDVVFTSVQTRRMAHTAEDLTTLVLQKDYNMSFKIINSDVRGGFVLNFSEKPDVDLYELEKKVKDLIFQNLDVFYYDESHIIIGKNEVMRCTGPRIHVNNTSKIVNFHLLKEYKFDHFQNMYALVGLVGSKNYDEKDLNRIMKEKD